MSSEASAPSMASPGHTIDPNHKGPIVNILVWIIFILSSLTIISKIIVKLGKRTSSLRWSRLQLDDGAILLSLVFSISFSVCISQQVRFGLGSHISLLSPDSLASFDKLGFAAEFLYISAICSANICGIFFGMLLEPGAISRRLFQILIGFTVIWYLVSIIVVAVQCNLPTRWQTIGNQCIDLEAFRASFDVINTFINLALAVTLCSIVWALQVAKERYLLVLLFGLRGLIIVPMVFRVHYLFQNKYSRDPTMDRTNATIASVFLLHATIIATCLPFMKPVMEQLQSGWSDGAVRTMEGSQASTLGTGWSAVRYPRGFKPSKTTNSHFS